LPAVQILQKYWGYDSFREPQLDIINAVVAKNDVIAVLPTGSGKSVIYQVAGLMLEGITLVISPLIALIEDQVNTLNNLGIKSIALTGGLSFDELARLLDNTAFGKTKFLFISPERLQNDYVQRRLSNMPISLITIDEAHCISEWGHDFRPSYLKLSILKNLLPETPIISLTATAKQRVIGDIEAYLSLQKPKIFKQSVFRNNISYQINDTEDKIGLLATLLKPDETAIVYVRTRKRTYQMADLLMRRGFLTAFFHGGMTLQDKQKSLQDWLDNKVRIMFATTAFGMGINKADVRKVVHLDLPESLENYVQESGRAGRDGKMSEAVILLSDYDITFYKNTSLKNIPSLEDVYKVYKSLYNHFYIAEGEGIDVMQSMDFMHFCNRFSLDMYKTLNVLQMLESEGFIEVNQGRRFFAKIQIIASPAMTRNYVAHKRLGYKVVDFLARNYTDILNLSVKIKTRILAKQLDMPRKELLDVLLALQKRNLIDYQPEGEQFSILFLLNRDENTFKYKSKNLQKRILHKKHQVLQVLAYVENDSICRAQFLADYFEEKAADNCGICDICQIANFQENSTDVYDKILTMLTANCMSKKVIQQQFKTDISPILDKLMAQQKITFVDLKYCKIDN